MKIVGGVVFVAGAFIWCGNVFGFFRTMPFLGWIIMLVGGAIFKAGGSKQ